MASDPQTWTELKASMAEWLNRSDLTSKLPEFIAFADRKFNRTLMVPDREETSTASTSGARLALSLIHISEPTRPVCSSRMPSSA